jgi:biotin transporter BioY
VLSVGGALAFAWVAALLAARTEDGHGHKLVPLWFLAGLVALLYAIWCGGLWLGLRLRRARSD